MHHHMIQTLLRSSECDRFIDGTGESYGSLQKSIGKQLVRSRYVASHHHILGLQDEEDALGCLQANLLVY